jgi:hypothetical protein
MQAPGLLRDQPAVRALLAATPAKRPKLTLLQGGGAR